MPENQTTWNSDKQAVKQTLTRPVGEMEMDNQVVREDHVARLRTEGARWQTM